ncbi:MAG: leucyl/phenylalanyl-tRNA--protein transferase [Candidatus Dadabacteria bacterium]|nr:leucyl/phenylalanyl-tRNA--protein transferase [Candidatus Dadabacteria bacterium]NIS09797.1 leucyl/phenylalanyl-tRNA--protein transferase [Candidatus Dadabacteria bacterium]NIV41153.1 leucyl/phenylalanyl-tRNA--protein transferase [Candidatus Dadabacteria bacterium]NIX16238.1 leucyl/phenylalanyl-tRNA--protein transferase [Candidatus Dadabacteria bacterium]NIY22858.1 leucyl/phenylalanyl-tRNA--protein transferase [Candidatus Dadabacteria bacterium]
MKQNRIFLLSDDLIFPNPRLADSSGFLAVGADLSIERLLLAYENGIFPWYSEDQPILWFSPDPRLVLFPDKFTVSRSLKKTINKKLFEVKFDSNFEEVIVECSKIERKNQDGTWITNDMIDAYINLHNKGYAHSVETYSDGKLAGGLYGVSLGGAFFGESMFHKMKDASKVALYYLIEKLKDWQFDFIDSQVVTEHMKSLGAEEISRNRYLKLLKKTLCKETKSGCWTN